MLYVKLDWYTAVFKGWTIDRIMRQLFGDRFKALEFYKELLVGFEKGYNQARPYGESFCFRSHGCRIEVPRAAYAKLEDKGLLFVEELDSIRFELSGEGLDFCREFGIDVDSNLNRLDFWEPFQSLEQCSWHLTRCDIAVDFINEKGDFLDQFGLWYSQALSDGTLNSDSRLCCSASLTSGQCFDYRSGSSVKCLQLGKSPRFLRIYDKCLEQAKNGIFHQLDAPRKYVEDCGRVDSWIRFELELRNQHCYKVMFQKPHEYDSNGLGAAMRYIEDNYLVRDPVKKEVLPFFRDLFDWTKTVVINPIFYFIQSDHVQVHENSVKRGLQRELLDLEVFGPRKHFKDVLKRWRMLYFDAEDEQNYRQKEAYRIAFANLSADSGAERPVSHFDEFLNICDMMGLIDEVFPDRRVLGLD